jgi:ketosteroid isomerase-like protein
MTVMDVDAAVSAHLERFNDAVRTGDYSPFVESFSDDAVMTFAGVPVGPFRGRPQILQAYQEQPPTSTMSADSVQEIGPGLADVAFSWDEGGSGRMRIGFAGSSVSELHISFDK